MPFTVVEQPDLAVDGIVTDANGDHWILFPNESFWRKVTKEKMAEAIRDYMHKWTPPK